MVIAFSEVDNLQEGDWGRAVGTGYFFSDENSHVLELGYLESKKPSDYILIAGV